MVIRPADHGVVASSAGGAAERYTAVSDVTLTSDTSSVDISSSGQWGKYDDLLLILRVRCSYASNRGMRMRINNTSSNYSHYFAQSTSQGSTPHRNYGNTTYMEAYHGAGSNQNPYYTWSNHRILCTGMNNSSYRSTMHWWCAGTGSASQPSMASGAGGLQLASSTWSSIRFYPANGNWKTGSRFTVYGLTSKA